MTDEHQARDLRRLFDVSFDMMGVADEGVLHTVNPAWTEHLGWAPSTLTSTPFVSFVHPDDVAATEAEIRDILSSGSSRLFRNRVRRNDDSYVHIEWSLRAAGDALYVGGRDVSQSVELQQRVARSEAIAVAILETAADPIVIIDTKGKILHVNAATTELFGYPYDEMMGQNVTMLMPEPYRSEHDGYLERYLTEGSPRIIGIGREVVAQRADGTTFPMALAVSEATTELDHLFTGIIHDLTERNRQRDELAAANTQLENRVAERTVQLEEALTETQRSNRDLEQFAYVASHDLQAPLRNVRQGLELLDEHLQETFGDSFDEEAEELRGLVVAAVTRMENLIRGLLSFSRVQQNPVDDRDSIHLGELAREVATMLTSEVEAVEGQIVVSDLPELTVNTTQMRQVFQNLFENAIRYRSPDRELRVQVAVEPAGDVDDGDVDDGVVRILVADNGIGIEAVHFERIFELFRRGHSGPEGVGLGLSICRRVIEGHGGRIWIESVVGQGATFFIELPKRGPSALESS